jgi:hypothetical protein
MTLGGLSERLGLPPRTLYRYRRDFPDQVPKNFDLETWVEFIGAIKNYSAERTRPLDQNRAEFSVEDQNDEHAEFSAGEERKQRILRLRLGNQVRHSSLERLGRNTVTTAECEEAMERIRAVVSADLLRLPGSLSHGLANREPRYIQQALDAAFRSALERLSRPETYLDSSPSAI